METRDQKDQTPRDSGSVINHQPSSVAHHLSAFFVAHSNQLILVTILIIASFLRFYALDASSLWSDEGNTWGLMSRSFRKIAIDASNDIHPPGYYWLLKIWTTLFSTSAWGLRSFSALLGTLLVFVTYAIGCFIYSQNQRIHWVALLAALAAALNPFQIYYSQEARMYLLLTLFGATLFWSLFSLLRAERQRARTIASIGYVLSGIAGLWTHYSFPIVLASAGLTHLFHLLYTDPLQLRERSWPKQFAQFFVLNLLVIAGFVPQIATAIEQVLNWPKGGAETPLFSALEQSIHLLLVGPLRSVEPFNRLLLLLGAIAPVIGFAMLWWRSSAIRFRRTIAVGLSLWLIGPLIMMAGLGLFSDSFLKFLLVASPPWTLLLASSLLALERPPSDERFPQPFFHGVAFMVLAAALISLAWVTLPGYYSNTNARDNYQGIARYVSALNKVSPSIVLLNAPGQQEVWRYYQDAMDVATPVLALPQQRPPDVAETIAALEEATDDYQTIYALFWATDESDPNNVIETWLDQNLFKAFESWQGNVRLASYVQAQSLSCQEFAPILHFGDEIELIEQCQPSAPQSVQPGQAALIELHWQASERIEDRYTVSAQLLNSSGKVVAQRDSEPSGGSQPTDEWQIDALVVDRRGISIPPGLPPGEYELIVVIYDAATGERLSVNGADQANLGKIHVTQSDSALIEIVPMMFRTDAKLGPVTLLGYDAYREGFSHDPETPIQEGDLVRFTFYWQAGNRVQEEATEISLQLGQEQSFAPLVEGYPLSEWRSGEFVRSEMTIPFDGVDAQPSLSVNGQQVRLEPLPAK